ncbi:hypothetical protein GQ43DRAFT_448301 [Delitschia confertaspora ATCC 74209]|uniref:Zn(2)-C6 fungal-type domain-containing protein n=1 Tax=Delitschia confertaspora ATCC 74209 TaxID=1513339 RepID=A0A9P4JM94_9PLEO|nr:hypothetical protein GQ43DRAFT_448301 [Delitschia confertaspora ATCC 74209]
MPALPLDWPAISSSELTRQNNAMFASPPSMGMVAGAITHNNTNLTNPLWNMNAPASEATTPSLDTMLDPSSGWMYLDASTGATVPLHPPFALPEPGTQVHTHALPALAEKQIEKRRSVSKQKLPKIASSFTERAQKVKLSRRQGRMSEEARAKAAQMRKNGPCIRCKLYKLGCDGNTPCQRCVKVIDSARSFLEPCSRANIETISLVRHVNGRFNQTEVSFLPYHWNEHENGPHVMDIMWNLPGYGPMLDNPAIPVVFRAYHPENLQVIDSTRNYWQTSNAVVTVDQPPYAVYDTAALMTNVERYLLRNQPMIEQWIFNHNQNNELALLTYNEAMRQRDQFGSHLLDLAIQMQCGAVVSQGYGIVWSSHIPGIKEYDYRTFGPSGYEAYDRNGRDRPLPTAIGHQMDVAILKHINRIQKQLLKELKKKIFNPGIKPWYELFLTFFVLLCNLEYIHGSAERYMNVKRNTMLEGQVSYIVKSQLEEWEFSASVLLQHFRCVLRGFLPLKLARDNLEELRVQAKLDPLAVQFVSNLVSLLGEGDPWGQPLSLVDLSGDSTAHKWIPQLFKESYG